MYPTRKRRSAFLATICLGVFLSALSASAADVTWSSTGSVTSGGDGNWTGNSTWWNGSSAVSWTDGDNATFSAAGNTTVNSNVIAGNLTFSSGTENILILNGAGNLTVNSGITATNTANSAALTFNIGESSLILGANQTWRVNNGGAVGTANLIVTSVISGSGFGITKAGNGTLTLSGNNTFNGAVTVSSGTLSVLSASGLGNAAQVFMGNGAELNFLAASGNNTVGQQLVGNGSLTLGNWGNGVLRWNGNLTNNATTVSQVNFNSAGTGTNEFNGVIQNTTNNSTVNLNFQSTQIWKLTGNNTFSGVITIGGGRVIADKLANQGNASSIGTGGFVRFGYFDNAPSTFEYVGSGASSNMQIRLGASSGTTNNDASFLHNGSGALVLTNGNFTLTGQGGDPTATRVLVLGGNNTANNTIQGIIGNSGANATIQLVKSGTGKWILSGNNTYTGGTLVNAGTLIINGNNMAATGAVAVGSGATLGGTGTIGGAATVNGNLRPGFDGPGVLTFSSSVTLGSTANLTMEINGTTRGTQYDGIDVTGALTYGGNLVLAIGSPFAAGNYTFSLLGSGSNTGSFASVSLSGAYSGSLTESSGVWSLASEGNTWTFTQSTGVLAVSAVPEPSTWALLGVCLGIFLVMRRRHCRPRLELERHRQ